MSKNRSVSYDYNSHQISREVGVRKSELRFRESDDLIFEIIAHVISLQEGHAVDKVEALSRIRAEVAYDQVNAVSGTVDERIEL